MKKIVIVLFSFLFFIGIFFPHPVRIFAQCDPAGGCNLAERWTCHEVCTPVYNAPDDCHQACSWEMVCIIPQSGGGSCGCCDDGACVFGCGQPPGGGGGGGGATATPMPTPTPTIPGAGTIQVRSALIPSTATTCAQVNSSTNYTPVDITLYGPSITTTKSTPVDGSYVSWSGLNLGTYGMSDVPPAGYALALMCWTKNNPPTPGSAWTTAPNADLSFDGDMLFWNLGYTAGSRWFQAQGGDVYAATTIRSYVPSTALGGRYVVTNGAGGTPGVVTYGTSYDFDNTTGGGSGETFVSSTNWLANETHTSTDYYAVMFHRFGSPATAAIIQG